MNEPVILKIVRFDSPQLVKGVRDITAVRTMTPFSGAPESFEWQEYSIDQGLHFYRFPDITP